MRGARIAAPAMRLLGQPIESERGLYYVALVWALAATNGPQVVIIENGRVVSR